MFVNCNKKNIEHRRCDTYIVLYNNSIRVRATPLYLYSYLFSTNISVLHTIFFQKIIYKGHRPDMFVERKTKSISSTVGATGILFYTISLYVSGLRPYIYSYLFFTNISVLRTYFLSKNYLQGAEPRYVCKLQQKKYRAP